MNITDGVTLAGDMILAVTFVVFVVQAQSMTRSTRASVYQTVAEQMMSIDRLFVEHPELRPYFYGSKPSPSEELDRERVAATCELFLDFMDNVVGQTRHIPEYLTGPWQEYFQSIASTSPSLREFWRTNRDWYDDNMRRLLDSTCLVDDQVAGPPVLQNSGDQDVDTPT